MNTEIERHSQGWLPVVGVFAHLAACAQAAYGLALLEDDLLQSNPTPSAATMQVLACAVVLWVVAKNSGSPLVPTGSVYAKMFGGWRARRAARARR